MRTVAPFFSNSTSLVKPTMKSRKSSPLAAIFQNIAAVLTTIATCGVVNIKK